MPQKFLIIQTAFIGDVVLATSLIENLHHSYPDTQIDFLLRKGNETLLLHHPFLNEVLIWNKKENKNINLFRLLMVIRRKKYDKVINVQRYAATGLLTAFSGAEETIGFDKNPFSFLFTRKVKHIFGNSGENLHEIDRNNLLIKHLNPDYVMRPGLYPSEADFNAVNQYKQGVYITISPASVWFTKQYPSQKWVDFINSLPSPISIYLLGGNGDRDIAEKISQNTDRSVMVNLCGQLNFLQSAALMKHALMNYVNDSAPMHFASAVNAPVTAVYCSTVPAFGYGPLSDKSFIVQRNEPLYCRPCGLHGHQACPEGHFICALDISTDQLLQTLK